MTQQTKVPAQRPPPPAALDWHVLSPYTLQTVPVFWFPQLAEQVPQPVPALLRHFPPATLGQHSPLVCTVPAGQATTHRPWSQMPVPHEAPSKHAPPAATVEAHRPWASGLWPLGHCATQTVPSQMPEAQVVPAEQEPPLLVRQLAPTSVVPLGQPWHWLDDVAPVTMVAWGEVQAVWTSPAPPIGPPRQ
jgi:hypothetical protein